MGLREDQFEWIEQNGVNIDRVVQEAVDELMERESD